MRKRKLWLLVVLFLLILTAFFFARRHQKPVNESRFLFGTLIRITAYGPGASVAVRQAFGELERIHELTSQTQGIVAKINAQAGKAPVSVGPEFFAFLRTVFKMAEASAGYFNPVIGALVELWDFGYDGKGRIPSPEEVTAVLPLTRNNLVVLDDEGPTVYLKQAGMKLDLSGVAKGYAIDRAWEILKRSGVVGALINGGESSIRVLGERPGGGPWRIAISHPRSKEWIGVVHLTSSQAVGTSADTQRYIEVEGKRYSHLLNPFTGYPPTDLSAVTIITDSAMKADLFSTAVFVAAAEDRARLLARQQLEALIIDRDMHVTMTPGFKTLLKREEEDEEGFGGKKTPGGGG